MWEDYELTIELRTNLKDLKLGVIETYLGRIEGSAYKTAEHMLLLGESFAMIEEDS
jgi:hypothetical protein